MRRNKFSFGFVVLILVVSLFPSILFVQPVKAESSFGYTPVETVKTYDDSIVSSRYYDGANHIFITPFGNFTFLQPGNIMRFTDYSGELVIEKSVFILQYNSSGSWLPLLKFVNVQVYSVSDTRYDFRYDVNYKYRGKNYVIAQVQIEFVNNGLYKPKISVSMNRTQDWDIVFGDPNFRWIWDLVPYVDEYGDGWKYWKNSTETVDITQISGTQELGNLTRLQFTDNTTTSLTAFLDVSDFGATLWEGGQETYWNSRGFVAVFSINEPTIDPTTYSEQYTGFPPPSYGAWVPYDVYSTFGVPKGAIVEIVCRNSDQDNERYLGVRAKGSSIDRRVQLHEAEGGGATSATMFVKTDATDGQLELYAEVSGCTFSIIGYFEGVNFIEKFVDLNVNNDPWADTDLSSYGVPANAVLQIYLAIRTLASFQEMGVREKGSTLERWINIDEAEGSGRSGVSMIVRADGNSVIETYATWPTCETYLLGWFGSNVDFTESWEHITFSGNRVDGVWETRPTSGTADAISYFSVVHEDSGSETSIGIRETGTSLERRVLEHEAEGGGGTGYGSTVILDSSSQVDLYCGDSSESLIYRSGEFSEIAGGEQYSRDVSQVLSWSGVNYHIWDASRDFTQGVTFSSDSSRIWILTRIFTLGISLASSAFTKHLEYFLRTLTLGLNIASDSLRTWDLSRSFTQGLSLASTTERLVQFIRNPVQGITASAEALRSWTLTRTFTQSITFSSNVLADLFKVFQRTLTLGIQLSQNALREWDLSRSFSQSVSFVSESLRTWTLTRNFEQGISFASSIWTQLTQGAEQFLRTLTLGMSLSTESKRTWDIARTLTQGLSFASLADRSWSLIRVATQSITATIEANRILSAIRQVSQNIAVSSSAGRIITFIRGLSQTISLSSEVFRTWSLSRYFTQGLSLISSIFIKLTEWNPPIPDPEDFIRFVTLSLELVSNNMRFWDLSRMFNQTISINSGVWAKWYQNVIRRYATMEINLNIHLAVLQTIINEFNLPLLLIQLTTFAFTGLFLLRDRDIGWGSIATMLWFLTAFATLKNNVNDYSIAGFYTILGVIFGVYVLYETAMMLKTQGDYWADGR